MMQQRSDSRPGRTYEFFFPKSRRLHVEIVFLYTKFAADNSIKFLNVVAVIIIYIIIISKYLIALDDRNVQKLRT